MIQIKRLLPNELPASKRREEKKKHSSRRAAKGKLSLGEREKKPSGRKGEEKGKRTNRFCSPEFPFSLHWRESEIEREGREWGKKRKEKKANLFADQKWSSCRDRRRLWIRICSSHRLHSDLRSLHSVSFK